MELNKIIHERNRLRIVTYLAASDRDKVDFNELQRELALTSGNLSVQLKRLKEAGYLEIEKAFKDNKSYTTARLTSQGRSALNIYLGEMENLIHSLK